MGNERKGYGFTSEAKEMVHDRGLTRCEFPGDDCSVPNNSIVHHLEACSTAKRDDKPKEVISDPDLNALLLCDDHAKDLDVQQAYQLEAIVYERKATRAGRHSRRKVDRSF